MTLSLFRPCQVDGILYYDTEKGGPISFANDSRPEVLLEIAERIAFNYLTPIDVPASVKAVADKFKAYGDGTGPLPTIADFADKKTPAK